MAAIGKKGQSVKMTAKQRHHLKSFIKEIEHRKGRGTELVSVYIPTGYDINKINTHLAQEQGTASNIKSKQTRDNVISALEKMIQHLKLFPKTPPNGLAAFAGNVAEREGQQDYQVWSIEPPIPLNTRIYRCDKEFVIRPLLDMIEDKEVYGLVVMDRRDATIALLKGKTIVPLTKTHSEVAGKTRAGGQCMAGDTLVQIADGSMARIGDLHNPYVVKAADTSTGTFGDSPITDKWDVKEKKSLIITTKSPRLQVTASPEHTFFVKTKEGVEEKQVRDLTADDVLVMPERIDVEGEVQRLSPKRFYNAFVISVEGQALLQRKREEAGLLQKELASRIGATQTYVSFVEIGKRNTSREWLRKLCEALGLDFAEFLERYTEPSLRGDVKLPEDLTPGFARFLGYIMGDGTVEEDRISLFEQSEDVAKAYQEAFDECFGMDAAYRFRESKNYHQLRFTSRPLVRLIKARFPELRLARDSNIPSLVLRSPDDVLAGFLRGFFDAEGYVRSRGVGLGINNKALAQRVQLSLLRFSIISSLHEYDNRSNPYSDNPRFTVDITEKRSVELFEEHVGFTSVKKALALAESIRGKSDKSSVRQVMASGATVRRVVEEAGYNRELFPRVNNFFRDERLMSKEVFRRSIVDAVDDEGLKAQLQGFLDTSLLPVGIASIEEGERMLMTDISVRRENFIANGLLVHNSAPRFERLREGATKDHYKKVADYMKEQFLFMEGLKGIIIGGPSTTTNDFMNKDYLTGDVKKKILAVKDLSYTDEFGLQELLEKSADVLAEEDVAKEKDLMQRFFDKLAKEPDSASYGLEATKKALELGAVDILLISEEIDDQTEDELETKAEEFGSSVEIISVDTREGVQLRDLGKVAAILRFPLQS
ncbi:helix-turn-helix domain-containing protein [Candidatus Woesearchaeota archaeon]|nr:helix-turn-helix domain-containing protein [Candidatus Woesearchaeota archaeon]